MSKIFNLYIFTKIKIFILNFINYKNDNFFKFIIKNIKNSYSQIFQDLLVLYLLKQKKNGSFIEIGVGNGIDLSNTYLLEKKYNWTGILCEPDIRNFKNIKEFRSSKLIESLIDKKCDDQVEFYLNKDPYSSSSKNSKSNIKKIYSNSVCLNHLFERNDLREVDYISIDTEGNEYEILKNFNFKKYQVKIFTVEHNFDAEKREKIKDLLTSNGYKNIYRYLSYMDDWYILEKLHL